jgi:hypothetical protein
VRNQTSPVVRTSTSAKPRISISVAATAKILKIRFFINMYLLNGLKVSVLILRVSNSKYNICPRDVNTLPEDFTAALKFFPGSVYFAKKGPT